jgi:hypothetical protein
MFSKEKTNRRIIVAAARNTALLTGYVFLVGSILIHGDDIFGNLAGYPLLAMALFLLLFVLSAFVCGLLALGQPAAMYVRGERKEALRLMVYTGLWLTGWVLLLLAVVTSLS